MSVGRLNGSPGNPRAFKARLAAKLSGITIDYHDIKVGVDNQSDEYLKKFPLGQIPSFESNDGLLLTESNAIAFHLANLKDNNSLLGKNKNELAKIHQYCLLMEAQCIPAFITIILPAFSDTPYDLNTEQTAYEKLHSILAHLDSTLQDKLHLVGATLTLADLVVGENLSSLYTHLLDEDYRTRFPHLTRYFLNYRNLPEIRELTGEVQLKVGKFEVNSNP